MNASCEYINPNDTRPPIPYSELTPRGSSLLHVICYHILLPPITVSGLVGNIFNLLVLTGKRVKHSMGRFERRANFGLQALACSDMFISIFAFPSSFISEEEVYFPRGFKFYYFLYCKVIINTFIMSSTWLTVILAAERYIAICEPLRSRQLLSLQRTRCAIVGVFLGSLAFNSVFLFKMKDRPVCRLVGPTPQVGTIFYTVIEENLFDSKICEHTLRALWAMLGNMLPLVLLLYFNVRLIMDIRLAFLHRKYIVTSGGVGGGAISSRSQSPLHMAWRSPHANHNSVPRLAVNPNSEPPPDSGRRLSGTDCSRRPRRDAETSLRITITLVAIVVFFLVLVAPVELVKHVLYFSTGGEIMSNATYKQAETVTNTMQAFNFSFNFVLYCCIIRSFRRTVYDLLCRSCKQRRLPTTTALHSPSGMNGDKSNRGLDKKMSVSVHVELMSRKSGD